MAYSISVVDYYMDNVCVWQWLSHLNVLAEGSEIILHIQYEIQKIISKNLR